MKKRKVVIFAVMALAMSVVGGGVVCEDTHAAEVLNLDSLMSDIEDQMDEYMSENYDEYVSSDLVLTGEQGTGSMVIYKPEGLESYLYLKRPGTIVSLINYSHPDFGYIVDLGAFSDEIETILMTDWDFAFYNDEDNTGEYQANSIEDGEIICRIYEIGVACNTTVSNYDLDEESKEILNGLMAALRRAGRSENMLSPTVNLDDSIVNSDFEPYQRITVGLRSINYLGGAAGLFYRVSPTSEWVFFTGTQAVLDCSAYDTVDLKRAFVGEVCYDAETGTNSVVALDEPASDGDGEDEGDAPTTPNTGLMLSDIEGMKKIAMVTLPAILIGGFGAKFAINRKNRKVKFNKR